MEKLNILIKKVFNKEIIFYGIFGVLSTLVNICSFYFLNYFLKFEENISNVIAIILAVLFAYFTNRKLVFNSTANTFKEKWIEFTKFIISRLFTMIVELAGFFLMFNICHIHKLFSKLTITIIVIILNYFFSKFFAFKKD